MAYTLIASNVAAKAALAKVFPFEIFLHFSIFTYRWVKKNPGMGFPFPLRTHLRRGQEICCRRFPHLASAWRQAPGRSVSKNCCWFDLRHSFPPLSGNWPDRYAR
jgi:hypothetical protein